jgi:outer membrane lipoprotein-sorting protein
MKTNKVLFLVLLGNIVLFASGDKTELILEKARAYASKVHDCQVTVTIIPHIASLKMPDTKATAYFKEPDKFKIKTDGMAFFPKTGFPFPPSALLMKKFTAIQESDEYIDKRACFVIKLVPSGGQNEVVLSTIWVDKQNYLIRKIESVTKVKGTFTILLKYENSAATQYGLPSSATYSFDLTNGEGSTADKSDNETNSGRNKKFTNGSVEANFYDYKINAGIDDAVFNSKSKGK